MHETQPPKNQNHQTKQHLYNINKSNANNNPGFGKVSNTAMFKPGSKPAPQKSCLFVKVFWIGMPNK
jgi:hypothetical protein